ncbi:hypothetical protein L6R52_38285 [Myxococcota bacterium]|nr:hypothetical protein [Myxococcota bacterium]
MSSLRLTLVMALLAALSLACPPAEPPVSATCTAAYAKCKLPSGPLGVCEPVPCDASLTGCLRCTSQH